MSPFAEWIAEVAADPIVIDPEDINHEAWSNLWMFSITQEQAKTVEAEDIIRLFQHVVAVRDASVRACPDLPEGMWFYLWHDDQALQLRFSMVSRGHGALPFGRALAALPDPTPIIFDFLKGYHDYIPFEDMEIIEGSPSLDDVKEPELPPLPLWVISLPTNLSPDRLPPGEPIPIRPGM